MVKQHNVIFGRRLEVSCHRELWGGGFHVTQTLHLKPPTTFAKSVLLPPNAYPLRQPRGSWTQIPFCRTWMQ